MKRLTAILLSLFFLLAGCSQNTKSPETPTDSVAESGTQIPGFENYVGDAQLEIFRTLISANAYFVTDVFYASTLPCDEKAFFEKDGIKYFTVKSDKFKTYADLEASVYSVYTEETAKEILENDKIYSYTDGIFCINSLKVKDTDYGYDWNGFKIEVKKASNENCLLNVTVKDKSGADKTIEINVVLSDGNWKLDKFYTAV